jgi:hypothetical protein
MSEIRKYGTFFTWGVGGPEAPLVVARAVGVGRLEGEAKGFGFTGD